MQRRTKHHTAFVYMIIVDDMIRYVGKGRGERHLTHAINARRDAARIGCKLNRLSPLMHRNLVKAIRAGSQIRELIIASGLSDAEAYRLEAQTIADFHRRLTGQLWNTIDERCMDKRLLPPKWNNPAHPLYRLPRPLVRPKGDLAARSRSGSRSPQLWVSTVQHRNGQTPRTPAE